MYITNIFNTNSRETGIEGSERFDWEMFFSGESAKRILENMDVEQVVLRAREHLQENRFRQTLVFNQVMRKLFKGREPHEPAILELGAATGFLTRWLTEEYGGTGVLVDNSEASYRAYSEMNYDRKHNFTYVKSDIFQLELERQFDLVCSFGLVEHFMEKRAVIEVHKRYTKPGGIIVIIIPMDTPLSRTFFELYPELNLGYRELLKEKEFKDMLSRHGLEILRTQASSGYSYDILAALCEVHRGKMK